MPNPHPALVKLKELSAAATKRPWRHRVINTGMTDIIENAEGERITPIKDWRLVCASANSLDPLIQSLEVAMKALERIGCGTFKHYERGAVSEADEALARISDLLDGMESAQPH